MPERAFPENRCHLRSSRRSRLLFLISAVMVSAVPLFADEHMTFNEHIRPILAESCWKCHGPDEGTRQAGLRLDQRDAALLPAESGSVAVVPGDPDGSELLARVTSQDDQTRMPPADTGQRLSDEQVRLLREWIAAGAAYQQHWAFERLSRPRVPDSSAMDNPIDAFVEFELQKHGLTFAPAAARETLLRRVSLDLTGLPPTLADLDRTSESWEETVDRLLQSPHFGERMAVDWLDAARYADTNGYFSDKPRQMWLWRDWVIDAFNSNMPYDQFTVEQLAGDLLPDARVAQRIATGFNRNHMANNETGIIDEEFRVEYVVDRVDTTLTTWMGLTVGCAQCHDHKYDPISQRDFYQLFAFFNNVPEQGLITSDNPPPVLTVTTDEQDRQLAELTASRKAAEERLSPLKSRLESQLAAWESRARQTLPHPPGDAHLQESFSGHLHDQVQPVGTRFEFAPGIRGTAARFDASQHAEWKLDGFVADGPWTIGFWMNPDGSLSCPMSAIEAAGDRRGFEILLQKGRIAVHLVAQWGIQAIEVATVRPFTSRQWHHIVVCYDGSRTARGLRILIDGVREELHVQRDSLTGPMSGPDVLKIGRRDSGLGYYGLLDELHLLSRTLSDQDVADWARAERIRGILEKPLGSRSADETERLLDDCIDHGSDEPLRNARRQLQEAIRAETEFRRSIPTTLVMEERPERRTTHVLVRGQYNELGEVVQPGIPAVFSGWPNEAPPNRLSFARWLVSADNPLTARVAVNRLWKQCFGEGLVRTVNDFGTQGERPSHPELLDWLAYSFRESGWDVKQLLRLIVTSRTYQQQSIPQQGLAATVDPQNRLLSRGARIRLSAEMLRDQALAVSGLLQPQIGGPSVKPYQPPGLWEEVSYNGEDSYVPDQGAGQWRRSLYTFLKRQAPPPALLMFDGTTREKCVVQRARTNTPLQALVLLNDPTYVAASQALAGRVMNEISDPTEMVRSLFRRVLARSPDSEEAELLLALYRRQYDRFRKSPDDAEALQSRGPTAAVGAADQAAYAAWTVVAHTLLNLDEVITRR